MTWRLHVPTTHSSHLVDSRTGVSSSQPTLFAIMALYWQGVLEWLAPSVHHIPSDFDIQTQPDCIELEDWASLHTASPATSTSSLPHFPASDLSSSVRQRRKGASEHAKSSSSPAAYFNSPPPLTSSPPVSRSSSKPRTSSTSSPRPSHSSFSPVLLIPGPGGLTTSLMFFPPDFSSKPKSAK